jgi:hypothetical protein
LTEVELFLPPVVYVKENVKGSDRERIKELVKRRGGQLTDEIDIATHIIHPKVSEISSDYFHLSITIQVDPNPDLYCRPVFRRGEKCLVHFIQMPDSSDNWGICYPENDPGVLRSL